VTRAERARWERAGFNVCPGCGCLAVRQTPLNAEAFASCAIEDPALGRLVCACKGADCED
jgi:hypothetical protein